MHLTQLTSASAVTSRLSSLNPPDSPSSIFIRSWIQLATLKPGLTDLTRDTVHALENDAKCVAFVTHRTVNEAVASIHFYCPEDQPDKLAVVRALGEAVNWKEAVLFEALPGYLIDQVATLCEEKQKGALKFTERGVCLIRKDPLPIVVKTEADFGFELRVLTLDDAEVVATAWHHRDECTLPYVRHQLRHGLGRGVFQGGELTAWGIIMIFGAIGLLHTKESHRGQGHARRLISCLSALQTELAVTQHSYVEEDNAVSMGLHRKSGFEVTHKIAWMGYEPEEKVNPKVQWH